MDFPGSIQFEVSSTQADFYLNRSFPFYNELNDANKQVFLERLGKFSRSKYFVPRQNILLSEEMVVIISACAIQLTFGLNNYSIEYFDTILVYPDIYQSPHSEYTHHGEVNLAGFVCLSWKSIKKGIDIRTDNFNVGLHEWAHALRFNGIKGSECDYFFENYFLKWLAVCNGLYNDIRTGRTKVFNKYGGTNIGEFFPVLIEHFFENPGSFKENYPKEYEITCALLNLDPLNKMNPVYGIRKIFMIGDDYTEPATIIAGGKNKGFGLGWMLAFLAVGICLMIALQESNFLCSGFLALVMLIPPSILLISRKKVTLTTSGVIKSKRIYDPLNRHTAKYGWKNIIKAEFIDSSVQTEEEVERPIEKYEAIYFTVYENGEFKTTKLYNTFYSSQAVKLETMFREKKVNVIRKRIN
ncbi:MAG: zinc-dependent peptidase [Bacteroidia bacterium]|nr:zinc-dependent peptidase [Bacteroidia bacterium]